MKTDDPKHLLQSLQNVPARLPRHQKALRDQLTTMHTTWRMAHGSPSLTALLRHTRVVIASHKFIAIGLSVASTLLILLGVLLLLPVAGNTPEHKLMAGDTPNQPAITQPAPTTPSCESTACLTGGQTLQNNTTATPTPKPVMAMAATAPTPVQNSYAPIPPTTPTSFSTSTPTPPAASTPANATANGPPFGATITVVIPNLPDGNPNGNGNSDQKKDKQKNKPAKDNKAKPADS